MTVFKVAERLFVGVRQSPFRIQSDDGGADLVHQDPPESAGLAVKSAVTGFS
jgi:hypothetical protein